MSVFAHEYGTVRCCAQESVPALMTFPKNRIFLNVRLQTTHTDTQTDKVRKIDNTKRKIHCIGIETSELED
jgi:hypothetical protein